VHNGQASAQEAIIMAVKKVGEKYHCNVCGNEVTVTKVGGGTLVCCGEDMKLLKQRSPAGASGGNRRPRRDIASHAVPGHDAPREGARGLGMLVTSFCGAARRLSA